MDIKDKIKKAIGKVTKKRANKQEEEVVEEAPRCANERCRKLLPAGYLQINDGRRFCSPACRGILR